MTTRNKRKRASEEILPVAAEAFRAALPLREHRENQIGDIESCPGINECATCQEYEGLVETIHRSLGLAADAMSPIDVADCPPPPWWLETNPIKVQRWKEARSLYCQLCDAAGIERKTKVEISDFNRAHGNLRWMERHLHVPEGKVVGQRIQIRSWQRKIILDIYGTGFGDDGDSIRAALGVEGS